MTASPADESNRVRRVPELDGLRGLAVVAVVSYHAWPEIVPGGWLGVSVFFTLSGYLITGILIRSSISAGVLGNRAELGRFWLTRARRLLPVALMTIAAVVVGVAVVDADSVRRVAGDALASIWYAQNWREAAAPGGYGAIFDSGLRPLAHMWSLSIEEQVYIALPLLMLWRGPRAMLAVGTVVAMVGTIVWWGSPDAYYATPVRLVEVLAGAGLAVWVAPGRAIRVPGAAGAAAGAGLVVAGAWLHESHDLVSRGALPLAAVLSVVVLAAVLDREIPALRSSALCWLGQRSYAIYLFHWPMLVLLDVPAWVAITLAGVVAEVSHRLVEWPIRSQRILTRRPARAFVIATGATVVFAAAALALAPGPASRAEVAAATSDALSSMATPTTTRPERPRPTPVLEPAESSASAEGLVDRPPLDPRIVLPPGPTVMILGDSTADAIEPALSGWVAVIGGETIDAAQSGCSPMFAAGHNTRWYTNLIADPTPCRLPVAPGTDVVVVLDHGVPLFDHFDRIAGAWTDLTDPGFVAELTARYDEVIADAAEANATVVFTTPPVPWPAFGEWPGYHTGTEVQRRLNYTELVAGLADASEHVHLIEFGGPVDADPERYPRDDGLHLDIETGAVHAVIDLIAPQFRLASS